MVAGQIADRQDIRPLQAQKMLYPEIMEIY